MVQLDTEQITKAQRHIKCAEIELLKAARNLQPGDPEAQKCATIALQLSGMGQRVIDRIKGSE